MSVDIDAMSEAELCAWVYTEVLGEAKPTYLLEPLGCQGISNGGNWWYTHKDGWQPVPADGNQMMRVVRAMAERGYVVQQYSWDDSWPAPDGHSANVKIIREGHCVTYDQIFSGADNALEFATLRAAAKAVREEEEGYKRARGAIPWQEGNEPAHTIIRRMRDGEVKE